MRIVYACRFFESRKHSKPHTNMYFLKAEHTVWAFLHVLSKIEIIYEPITSDIYNQAKSNSIKHDTCRDITRENYQFKHLFIKDCNCLKHGYDKCLKDVLCKECNTCMSWMGYSEDQTSCITCLYVS